MPGKLFVPAQDGTISQVNNSINSPAYGPALDATLHTGVPPVVPGLANGQVILQGPGGSPYTIYTFVSTGKVWAASVSLGIAATTGVASGQNAYARVYTNSGLTLAYCEVAIDGSSGSGSNGDNSTLPGFVVPAGTQILLDINGGVAVAGAVMRGGGLFIGSVP